MTDCYGQALRESVEVAWVCVGSTEDGMIRYPERAPFDFEVIPSAARCNSKHQANSLAWNLSEGWIVINIRLKEKPMRKVIIALLAALPSFFAQQQ